MLFMRETAAQPATHGIIGSGMLREMHQVALLEGNVRPNGAFETSFGDKLLKCPILPAAAQVKIQICLYYRVYPIRNIK